MNIRQAVPFFMVADMATSLAFYVEGLGFRRTKEWTPQGAVEWCWLERDGVALMLQSYREGQLPAEKRGAGVSVCFQCEDALALYKDFMARGVTPKQPFVGNNMWVVVVTDADGYRLDFESETDVSEETIYDPLRHG